MCRLSEYGDEDADRLLGLPLTTPDNDFPDAEPTPEEENRVDLFNRLTDLGILAADTGEGDLASALADLEILFLVGLGPDTARRLRATADGVRAQFRGEGEKP